MATYRLQDLPEFTGTILGTDLVLVKILARDSTGTDTDAKMTVTNFLKGVSFDTSKFLLKGGDIFAGDMTMNNTVSLKGLMTGSKGAVGIAVVNSNDQLVVGDDKLPLILKSLENPAYLRTDGTQFYLYHTGNKPSATDIGAVPTTRTVNGHALNTNVTLAASELSGIDLYMLKADGYTKVSGVMQEPLTVKNNSYLSAQKADGSANVGLIKLNGSNNLEIGQTDTFMILYSNSDIQAQIKGYNQTLLHDGNFRTYINPNEKLKAYVTMQVFDTAGTYTITPDDLSTMLKFRVEGENKYDFEVSLSAITGHYQTAAVANTSSYGNIVVSEAQESNILDDRTGNVVKAVIADDDAGFIIGFWNETSKKSAFNSIAYRADGDFNARIEDADGWLWWWMLDNTNGTWVNKTITPSEGTLSGYQPNHESSETRPTAPNLTGGVSQVNILFDSSSSTNLTFSYYCVNTLPPKDATKIEVVVGASGSVSANSNVTGRVDRIVVEEFARI
ncbi:tail protein [Erwinia phage vB_Eam-MM7]|uniref:Tail fiber n=1 Tax=Erwinia phage vB_Eam-MM7 TaxID=1051674 RepID=G0YPM2_9CAUD|nr:tail protein [Erwinia phage vB_Eam-MM7]AEJ81299.1 tail fiber [Erwinia phage vB_Eam-MM7]